nr:MAG TPA: hypothetical protein [Caudoviricetes sp.]
MTLKIEREIYRAGNSNLKRYTSYLSRTEKVR